MPRSSGFSSGSCGRTPSPWSDRCGRRRCCRARAARRGSRARAPGCGRTWRRVGEVGGIDLPGAVLHEAELLPGLRCRRACSFAASASLAMTLRTSSGTSTGGCPSGTGRGLARGCARRRDIGRRRRAAPVEDRRRADRDHRADHEQRAPSARSSAARGAATWAVPATAWPHSAQKRASGSSLAPHCVQNRELMRTNGYA